MNDARRLRQAEVLVDVCQDVISVTGERVTISRTLRSNLYSVERNSGIKMVQVAGVVGESRRVTRRKEGTTDGA